MVYKVIKKPLMTQQATQALDSMIGAPIDFEGRSLKNVHKLMKEHRLTDIIRDYNMDNYLFPFKRIINREKSLI